MLRKPGQIRVCRTQARRRQLPEHKQHSANQKPARKPVKITFSDFQKLLDKHKLEIQRFTSRGIMRREKPTTIVIQPADNQTPLLQNLQREKEKIEMANKQRTNSVASQKISHRTNNQRLTGTPHGLHAQTPEGYRYHIEITFNNQKEAVYNITPLKGSPKPTQRLNLEIIKKLRKRISQWAPNHSEFFIKNGYKI